MDSMIAGRAAFLARDGVVEVTVADRVDERHGAAAGHGRHRLRTSSRRTTRTPGVCGPPGNLCGDRKIASLWSSRVRPGCGDANRHVGPGGGVVPERQRAVGVQQRRDRAGVGEDPGDVGGSGEAADPQRALSRTGRAGVSRSARSMWPSASSPMTTTSAIDSRQGSSLEWCSYGPTKTTGRSASGMRPASWYRSSRPLGSRSSRMPISLFTAAVAPDPQKMTRSSPCRRPRRG